MHRKLKDYVKELNLFYLSNPPMWQTDDSWDGFRWINAEDRDNSVLSYIRTAKDGKEVIVCANFTPVHRESYYIEVPSEGEYEVALCSDYAKFGGGSEFKKTVYKAKKADGRCFTEIDLPGLTAVYLKKTKKEN